MSPGKDLAIKEETVGTLKRKIYLLHGWTCSLDKWQNLIAFLKEKDLEPVVPKIPGLTQELNKVWDINDYVEWLKKETKGSGSLILLGHSNGGRIALTFAAEYPQKIAHLILIDSAGIYHKELLIRLKRLFFKSLAKFGKKLSSSKILRTLLYKAARENDYKNANPVMRQTLVNLLESDKELKFNKIKVPTTIIWGEKDKITPLSDGKIMAQKIKSAELHIIKGARHSPQFTNPYEVGEEIIKALRI